MDFDVSMFSREEWARLKEELSLSPRQAQVVSCLLAGLSDKQISAKMHIAVPTLRTYLSRIFTKFDIQDRQELIIYVFGQFRECCSKDYPMHQ